MKIKITELRELATSAIKKAGNIKEADIEKILSVLLFADMTGRSTQGVIKLTGTEPLQNIIPEKDIEVLKETAASAHIHAHRNAAPLATSFATEKVIEKCKNSGIGVVGLKGIYTSNGPQAYYVNKIAEAGFVGVVASRSPGVVAPHGGKEPLFGTNPIGFGFPSMELPILFDMASSAITWYGLVKAKAEGVNIPDNVAIDKDGNLTTDPAAAMDGAVLPFDRSYKGAGLAMVIELLAGPLVGASFCNINVQEDDWGAFLLAIDPGLFGNSEDFKKAASEMVRIVKNSQPRKEGDHVSIPGDRTYALYQQSLASGEVEVSDAILAELRELV
jgi:LDH2 family malate/lactate/ureidoglycolate dehydrogenase